MSDAALFLLGIAISGAIVVLAGAMMILAAVRGQSLTESSRLRLVGIGYLFFFLGGIPWLTAVIVTVIRLIRL